jgi:hypothetical protein
MYEQLAAPPLPTKNDAFRSQIGLSGANYVDSYSLAGQGVLDLTHFEVAVGGSLRLFSQLTERGKGVEKNLAPSKESLLIEIAKFYATRENHYGRLGLGYLQFFPESKHWVRLSFATGIMATPGNPWSLNLHAGFISSIEGNNRNLIIQAKSMRVIQEDGPALSVGGYISWAYRMRDVANDAVATYEQMLFSIGPTADLTTALGTLSLKLPWRLWIDKEYVLTSANTYIPGNPNEFIGLPDVNLSWTLNF